MATARSWIDGATLLDPEGRFSGPGLVRIADGRIEEVVPSAVSSGAPGASGDRDGRGGGPAARGSGAGAPGPGAEAAGERIDGRGLWLAPGFVDLHFHGELLFARPETFAAALRRAGAAMVRHGTTSFLATTVTWPADRLRDYVTQLAETMTHSRHDAGGGQGAGARPIGLHLEGPWISPACAGAQPADSIRPYRDEDASLLDACGDALSMVTLAPEIEGADRLLDALHRRGVIPALGHSRVEADAVDEVLRRGMTHVTHLFNAMGPMHHRAPGLAGAVLGARTPVSCDLICDGIHVAPDWVRVAARSLGERLALISDRIDPVPPEEGGAAAEGGGADFGSGELVDDGRAWRLAGDGRLAGSRLSLDAAVRNAVAWGAMTPVEAIASVTLRPARLLGREAEIGTLRPGARADLVLLDPDLRVVETFVGGRPVGVRGDAGRSGARAEASSAAGAG